MNDLHYIFYDARKMYLDTSDMSCECERAHRRLCDFIWFGDVPPDNQNDTLKQVTHTKESDWSRVKRELLAKGWMEVGAYFLHRGAIKSLNESKKKYVETYNRTAQMNKKTPLVVSDPHSVTGIVTYCVTANKQQQESNIDIGREVFGEVEAELRKLFNRPEHPPLSYAEQSALSEISRRPDALKELAELVEFKAKPENWFPQSMQKLLSTWQETLDRARTHDERKKSNANGNTNRPDRNAGTFNATRISEPISKKIR